jgi:hypothetical protein
VAYSLTLHLVTADQVDENKLRWAERLPGGWVVHHLYLSRAEGLKDPSDAARRKATEVLGTWLAEFAASEQGQAMLATVARLRLDEEIRGTEEAIQTALAKAEELRTNLVRLHAKRALLDWPGESMDDPFQLSGPAPENMAGFEYTLAGDARELGLDNDRVADLLAPLAMDEEVVAIGRVMFDPEQARFFAYGTEADLAVVHRLALVAAAAHGTADVD